MAKYSSIELDIRNEELVVTEGLRKDQKSALKCKNCIYIYRGTRSKKIYIGQTKNFTRRHGQHYNEKDKKFNAARFDKVIVLFSVYLDNGTALDDVESQLITYFNADRKDSSNQYVSYDNDVINRTAGNSVTEYRDREKVASDVILPFWEQVLYPKGWVMTPTLKS